MGKVETLLRDEVIDEARCNRSCTITYVNRSD